MSSSTTGTAGLSSSTTCGRRPPSSICTLTPAGAWGFGAFYGVEQRWIQGQWSGEDKEKSSATWGHHWSSRRIQLHCDNEAVVACVRSGTSRAPHLMPLLRCLVMLCARRHVAGRSNVIADALSRVTCRPSDAMHRRRGHFQTPFRPYPGWTNGRRPTVRGSGNRPIHASSLFSRPTPIHGILSSAPP